MSEQKSVLVKPLWLRESWTWAPDEYIRLLRQTEAGSVYRVRAIHVAKSLNRFAYTEEELRLAGRTLGYRPLNLNHEQPPLPFPFNRVIDSEYEDECVEALIVVADPCIIQLIEAKKIVAVSIEGQYRWADLVCDEQECVWNPRGIVLTALALLTPGVEPGDPLASIVMKKRMETKRTTGTALMRRLEHASPIITGTTSLEVDTKPTQGGVLMEKKEEATPPLEPAKTELPQTATPAPDAPTSTSESGMVQETAAKPAADPCQELIGKANEEIAKLRDQVSTLESQVRLLQERRKGSRGN